MPPEDVQFAIEYARLNNLQLVFCVCVNANQYIENKLPPIAMFIDNRCNIVLGTDSYSSNWQLSIAKEIGAIVKNFPGISLETILGWATREGAIALQWENDLGSFEKGKIPGVVLIDDEFNSKRIL
jgi:imidazolonepropionase-like amidohydrolase